MPDRGRSAQWGEKAFLRKLQAYAPISEGDRLFLTSLTLKRRKVSAGQPFPHEVENALLILISGMACRFKTLRSGKRQISALLLPGDFCGAHASMLRQPDHEVAALCKTLVAEVNRAHFDAMLARPALARALLFSTLVDESILREWVGNIGRRNAVQKMAHLFCETYIRLRSVGTSADQAIEFPLTQADLSDCLGLSLVHTNKSLRQLRESSFVTFQQGVLRLLDAEGLRELCGFDESYLHLEGGKLNSFERN